MATKKAAAPVEEAPKIPRKVRMKSFPVVSNSTFVAVLYFTITVPIAVVGSIIGYFFVQDSADKYSMVVLVALPFGYALAGFLITAIACWIYNWLAKMKSLGGIEVVLSEE